MNKSRVGRTCRLVCPEDMRHIVDELLGAEGFGFYEEPFHPMVRTVNEEPLPLGSSLAARFGLIYIQDRSSMLPPFMLAPPKGATVLDMCSAPGSKTGLLAQLVGSFGMVFGNEPNTQRLGILRNNLRRLSFANTATANSKGEKLPFEDQSFTYILLDPPCSGWGTENKHPGISDLWTGEKTKPLIRLQRKLLTRAVSLLRPGGRLMYSTCTTNVAEDEEQVAWAVQELGLVALPLESPAGFTFAEPDAMAPGSLKVADEDQGQGFYLAAFTLPSDSMNEPEGEVETHDLRLPGKRLDVDLLDAPTGVDWSALPAGEVWDFGGRVFFLHEKALAKATPKLRWQGLALGRVADGVFRPDGLCRALLGGGDGVLNLQRVEDLAALVDGRGVAGGTESGFIGLKYRGLPLGWARCKSGRVLWAEKQMAG